MINLYIANLGKYVEGKYVGDWIELPYTTDELHELFVKIKLGYYNNEGEYEHGFVDGNGCVYEEWAIHDYETDIGIKIGEYDDLNKLNEMAIRLDSLTEGEMDVVKGIIEVDGCDFDDAIDRLDDVHVIQLDTETLLNDDANLGYAYIEQVYGDVSELDRETLERYFDYEAFSRELRFDFSITSNGLAISRN